MNRSTQESTKLETIIKVSQSRNVDKMQKQKNKLDSLKRQLKEKEQQLELERKLVQLATERELTIRGDHEKIVTKRLLI